MLFLREHDVQVGGDGVNNRSVGYSTPMQYIDEGYCTQEPLHYALLPPRGCDDGCFWMQRSQGMVSVIHTIQTVYVNDYFYY